MADLTFPAWESAAEPSCPVHGQMRFDFPMDRWTCHGWDGEGCGHVVCMEDLDWIPVQDIRMAGGRWLT